MNDIDVLMAPLIAEIEVLRAEVERWRTEATEVANGAAVVVQKAEARAERLADALQGMVENACAACEVLPNGTHRIDVTEQEWVAHVAATDKATAVLDPTATQRENTI